LEVDDQNLVDEVEEEQSRVQERGEEKKKK
jgi:hypothetical protein